MNNPQIGFYRSLLNQEVGFDNKYSMILDGVDEYISIADDAVFDVTTNFTILFWIKTTSAAEEWAFSKYNWVMGQRSYAVGIIANRLRALISDDAAGTNLKDYRSDTWINNGDWRMVGITFSPNDLKLWLDGVDDTSSHPANKPIDDTVNSVYSGTSPVTIGGLLPMSGLIDASIDEIGVWDTTLSAAEILELYNGGTPIDLKSDTGNYTSSSNLTAYYRMGDDGATWNGSMWTIPNNASAGSPDATSKNMEEADRQLDAP